MVGTLDRILASLASLRLAIGVIVSLAVYLGVATFYEARYGAPAVQRMVYGSPVFVGILALLAINVAAAVIVRYPWKRKQTGFIITHIGIEVLLIGCAVSIRSSVDGLAALSPGDATQHINLLSEHLQVALPDQKEPRAWRADWWDDAGYPGAIGFLLGKTPDENPNKPLAHFHVNDDISLTLDRWLPAARFVSECRPGDGPAALKLRLHGKTPAGADADESIWLHATQNGGRVAQLFGGGIEAALWTARSDREIEQFLEPIDASTLGASGQLRIDVGGAWQTIDVASAVQKEVALGTTGLRAQIMRYIPSAIDDRPQMQIIDTGQEPTNPYLVVRVHSKDAVDDYAVSARYPFQTRREVSNTKSPARPLVMVFDHPAILRTDLKGIRGRIQLLCAGDKTYYRQFGTRGELGSGELTPGKDVPSFMGLKLGAEAYLPGAVYVEEFVPARVPASKMTETMRAALVTVKTGVSQKQVWLARGAAPTQVETEKGPVALSYTFDGMKLPFTLSLIDAKITRAPGSDEAAAYESRIRAVSDDGTLVEHAISMNAPATIDGLTFYQQSVNDQVPGEPISQLSVRRDAGWTIKYAGCGLIVLGIFTMFYMKAYFAKSPTPVPASSAAPAKRSRRFRRPVAATVILLLLCAPSWAMDAASPVLHDGRVMPLDTLARQTVRFVTGRERFEGREALEALQSWQAEPAQWQDKPILHVPNLALRDKVAAGQQWVSPGVLKKDDAFAKWTTELLKQQETARKRGEEVRPSKLEEAALDLRQRLHIFEMARSGELIVPATENVSASHLQSEVAYNRTHPFRWVWIGYGVATIALIAAAMSGRRMVHLGAMTLLTLAIVTHASAFAWRCTITGWAPVTNMYETIVWVALVAAILAGVLALIYKSPSIALSGAVTALLGGIIADVMPPSLGREIGNLTPALRSNYWLTIHVLTIVSSYAAFALACVLGNVWLTRYAIAVKSDERRATSDDILVTRRSSLSTLIYRTLQVGVLLLAAGTILGGMWADQSWGRFWGWDPKEVWALVALLTYLALLHGRFAGWVGPFGVAAGSVLGFATVLMSWYGVNFVLGVGLHSYGFGTGGQTYVGAYVVAQVLFVLVARLRHRAMTLGVETDSTSRDAPHAARMS